MGILNITENSFSDGGEYYELEASIKQLHKLIEDGADIIDIGAESTKPYSKAIPPQKQLDKLIPVLEYLKTIPHPPISIDTRSSEIASKCIELGADIINDVSGMDYDEQMADTLANFPNTKIILQHSQGTPENMQDASIAVPNDTTNEARALLLLQDNGILTLKEGVGLEATVRDIEENPHNVEIQELEAAQVPRVKDEVAFVVLNGNYAMEAGFSVAKDAVSYEQSDSEAAQTYVNVIAVKEGNENSERIKALVAALKSDTIKEYINNTYDGGVIPFTE